MPTVSGVTATTQTDAHHRIGIQGRHYAAAGLIAPLLFALGLVLITWAEYDYLREIGFSVGHHHDSAWPSGLAQGPHGWAQIVNYALFGGLLLAFSTGLRREFRRRRPGRIATSLLTVLGLGFVLAAFPEDGPPFGEPQTWAGYVHSFGFLGVVIGSLGAPLACAFALRGAGRWRGYPTLSAAAAAACFVFLFVLVFALEVATTLGMYGFLAALLVWIELMARRLWRISHRAH
jgi:hypothetical protein